MSLLTNSKFKCDASIWMFPVLFHKSTHKIMHNGLLVIMWSQERCSCVYLYMFICLLAEQLIKPLTGAHVKLIIFWSPLNLTQLKIETTQSFLQLLSCSRSWKHPRHIHANRHRCLCLNFSMQSSRWSFRDHYFNNYTDVAVKLTHLPQTCLRETSGRNINLQNNWVQFLKNFMERFWTIIKRNAQYYRHGIGRY